MKAVRVYEFGGPEQLRVEPVEPPRPGPGEFLVDILAAGVNPVDTYIRSGGHAVKPALPYTPGIDGAGIVSETGANVSRFGAGDRVYVAGSLSGTYAERAICREDQVHPLPDSLSFAQGAALGIPYATAWRALFPIGHAVAGEWLLVHGASGGVGIGAVQLGRAAGLTVVGTAGSEKGRALVQTNGAHHVLDHHAPDMLERILDLTSGRGMDLILAMRADLSLSQNLRSAARGGRVVVIGSRGTTEIDPRDAMVREATIRGAFLFNTTAGELRSIHAGLGAALDAGVARPVIGREFNLSDVRQAHETVLEAGALGKIVLIP